MTLIYLQNSVLQSNIGLVPVTLYENLNRN